jgi:hypothetical protein
MAVTPNYSWPVPVATDFVKDGWEAISDLGNAIDTTVGGLGSGLKLIASDTFSAQTTVSFDSCFSSTYTSYKIIVRLHSNTASTFALRVRSGTTDLTTTTYRWVYRANLTTNTAYSAGASTSANSIPMSPYTNTIAMIDLNDVFETRLTGVLIANTGFTTASNVAVNETIAGFVGNTTAYDGFSIITTGGNISGTISVYGYQE